MEKKLFKKMGIIFALSLLAIGTTVTIGNGLDTLSFNAHGDTTNYTLTLDSSNGQLANNAAQVIEQARQSTRRLRQPAVTKFKLSTSIVLSFRVLIQIFMRR